MVFVHLPIPSLFGRHLTSSPSALSPLFPLHAHGTREGQYPSYRLLGCQMLVEKNERSQGNRCVDFRMDDTAHVPSIPRHTEPATTKAYPLRISALSTNGSLHVLPLRINDPEYSSMV